jgi:hypothetical protein
LSGRNSRLEDDEPERVREQVAQQVRSFAGPAGIELPGVSVVASAS